MTNQDSKKTTINLDVGCSTHKLEGFIGVDLERVPETDIVADLHNLPFRESSIDAIHSRHVLEHVADPHRCISEIYRVLHPRGKAIIIVPHFSSSAYWMDMTHLRPFSVRSFEYFDLDHAKNAGFPIYLPEINIKTKSARLIFWPKRLYIKKAGLKRLIISVLNSLMNRLAQLNPFLCERFWCNWVGGFYEVEFELRVVKM